LLSGCFSKEPSTTLVAAKETTASPAKKPRYQWCTCNFNRCLGARERNCTSIIRCKNTTAADYARNVGNRRALLVLDEYRFCINPMEGLMTGN
jgi:hypothetical protein